LLQARSQHAEPQHERPHVARLLLSLFFVRESRGHAAVEAQQRAPGAETAAQPSFGQILLLTSWRVRARFAVSQAGMINNLNDGMAWGLFPLYFALAGRSLGEVSLLAAIYPAVWGLVQLGTGALSDHLGRTWLISPGMLVQAGARFLIMLMRGFWPWAGGAALARLRSPRLPALARRWLRRGRAARRCAGRHAGAELGHWRDRGADAAVWYHRGAGDGRNPADAANPALRSL